MHAGGLDEVGGREGTEIAKAPLANKSKKGERERRGRGHTTLKKKEILEIGRREKKTKEEERGSRSGGIRRNLDDERKDSFERGAGEQSISGN